MKREPDNQVVKATKGIRTDHMPNQQDRGALSYALNGILDSEEGNLFNYSTAPGSVTIKYQSQIPYGNVCGHVNLSDGGVVVFAVDDNDMCYIFLVDKGEAKEILRTDELGFSTLYPISGVSRIIKGCENIVYWCDGHNPDRVLNIDDLDSYKDENGAWITNLMSLQPDYTMPYAEDITVMEGGGKMEVGGWKFALQALDEGGNVRFTSTPSHQINIYPETQTSDYQKILGAFDISSRNASEGGVPATSKSVVIKWAGVSPVFKSVQLIAIAYTTGDGVTSRVVVSSQRYDVDSNGEVTTVFNGFNPDQGDRTGTWQDIINVNERYTSSYTMLEVDSRLVRANLKKEYRDWRIYQAKAAEIKVKYAITEQKFWDTIGVCSPRDPYTRRGLQRGEVYAFGIVYIFANGETSPAFHIPGRIGSPFEVELLDVDANNLDDYRIYGFSDPTDDIGYGPGKIPRWMTRDNLPSQEMQYYEIPTITYPDNDPWPQSLQGQRIRHHRVPSVNEIPLTKFRVASDASGQWRVFVSRQLVHPEFHHVDYPEDDVVGHYFVMAKRDEFNRRILDSGYMGGTSPNKPFGTPNHIAYKDTCGGAEDVNRDRRGIVLSDLFNSWRTGPGVTADEQLDDYRKYAWLYLPRHKFGGAVPQDGFLEVHYIDKLRDELQPDHWGRVQDIENIGSPNNPVFRYKESNYDWNWGWPGDNVPMRRSHRLVGYVNGGRARYTFWRFDRINDMFIGGPNTEELGFRVGVDGWLSMDVDSRDNSLAEVDRPVLNNDVFSTKLVAQLDRNLEIPGDIPAEYEPKQWTYGDDPEVLHDEQYPANNWFYVSVVSNRILYPNLHSLRYYRLHDEPLVANDVTDSFVVQGGDTYLNLVTESSYNWVCTRAGEKDGDNRIFYYDVIRYDNILVESTMNLELRVDNRVQNKVIAGWEWFDTNVTSGFPWNDILGDLPADTYDQYIWKRFNQREDGTPVERSPKLTDYAYHNPDYGMLYGADFHASLPYDYDYDSSCIEEYPNRIIWSPPALSDSVLDAWLVNKTEAYGIVGENSGPIRSLYSTRNLMLIQTERSLFLQQPGPRQMKAGKETVNLSVGDFLSVPAMEYAHTDYGVGGCYSKLAGVGTEHGYFFVQESSGRLFIFTGQKLEELSSTKYGNSAWLRRNLPLKLDKWYEQEYGVPYPYTDCPMHPHGIGIQLAYDPYFERIIIHKKDFLPVQPDNVRWNGDHWSSDFSNKAVWENHSFTLTFSLPFQVFDSWHSWQPHYMFCDDNNVYMSVNNQLEMHLHEGNITTYFGNKFPFITEATFSSQQLVVAEFLEYYSRTFNSNREMDFPTFDKLIVYTDMQNSGELQLQPKTPWGMTWDDVVKPVARAANNYRISGVRDMTNGQGDIWSREWQYRNAHYQGEQGYIDKALVPITDPPPQWKQDTIKDKFHRIRLSYSDDHPMVFDVYMTMLNFLQW